MVVVCQAHLCAGAYSYLHEFLNLWVWVIFVVHHKLQLL